MSSPYYVCINLTVEFAVEVPRLVAPAVGPNKSQESTRLNGPVHNTCGEGKKK